MDHVDRILAQWHAERPDLDVGPMGTIGRLGRLAAGLSRAMEAVFAAHGLTAASFDVLATLRRAGTPDGLSPGGLMAWTLVTSGTMTNRLDRLEAQGLVERVRNDRDGRSVVVRLTVAGRTLIDSVVTEHVALQHRLVASLDTAERESLDGLLKRWLAGLEAGDPAD